MAESQYHVHKVVSYMQRLPTCLLTAVCSRLQMSPSRADSLSTCSLGSISSSHAQATGRLMTTSTAHMTGGV